MWPSGVSTDAVLFDGVGNWCRGADDTFVPVVDVAPGASQLLLALRRRTAQRFSDARQLDPYLTVRTPGLLQRCAKKRDSGLVGPRLLPYLSHDALPKAPQWMAFAAFSGSMHNFVALCDAETDAKGVQQNAEVDDAVRATARILADMGMRAPDDEFSASTRTLLYLPSVWNRGLPAAAEVAGVAEPLHMAPSPAEAQQYFAAVAAARPRAAASKAAGLSPHRDHRCPPNEALPLATVVVTWLRALVLATGELRDLTADEMAAVSMLPGLQLRTADGEVKDVVRPGEHTFRPPHGGVYVLPGRTNIELLHEALNNGTQGELSSGVHLARGADVVWIFPGGTCGCACTRDSCARSS